MSTARLPLLALVLALSYGCATSMSRDQMESQIEASSSHFQGETGAVQFVFGGVRMACISDVAHDRMRIVAPIVDVGELTTLELERMLISNYHSSLDSRYAISGDVVYAAFLHPLSSLSEDELASALRQVSTLARTFGSSYSSGELFFGGEEAR